MGHSKKYAKILPDYEITVYRKVSYMERYTYSKEQREILEGMQVPFAIYQFIEKRVVTLILSDGFCEMFGYKDRSLAYHDMDHNMYKDTHPDDVARISNEAIRFALEGGEYEAVYRSKRNSSSEYNLIHAKGKHFLTDTGVRLAQVWYFDEGIFTENLDMYKSDVATVLGRSMIRPDSNSDLKPYDQLTGLANMVLFSELAESGIKEIEKSGDQAVMLFLDLSGMKFFNSKYGFAEGDKLLLSFAKLLCDIFNAENCCHMNGDHFAVFTKEEELEDILYFLFLECRSLNNNDSLPVRVGIYPYRLEHVPISIACDRAKLACDLMRSTYSSSFKYYDNDLRDDAERRQYVLSNLDKSLKEKWIKVYYQPIVRAVNRHVCDEEALARWIDPNIGFLSPGEFIPALEEAGLIYKLDLYVLEQVLEKMNSMKEHGFSLVPHSINLSRVDFDICDIVFEVCKRVDAAGIDRSLITIEVTESSLGFDFAFMKDQILRFQNLGFKVWMDDFGSGYSSLDVLQSVKFDLLKFDMSFMRKLNESENGKVVLTELMKMATALGLDTVCEGVETEDQVRFLSEIGCSKLQGFYFCKPIPVEQIIERYKKGLQIGFEDPAQSSYYNDLGRINLFDFSVIADNEGNSDFQYYFNTLPMGIIEVNGNTSRFVRYNKSYHDFIKRFFKFDLSVEGSKFMPYENTFVKHIAKTCNTTGTRLFYDDRVDKETIVHIYAKNICTNPVNGNYAIAIIVLSISDYNDEATYSEIARSLASDYYNIYVIDLDTEHFIEYTSTVGADELAVERHGEDFFAQAVNDTMTRIYKDDREKFLSIFSKENVVKEIDEHGLFTTTYRLIDTGTPMYVNMKVTRMSTESNRLIMGISVIDSQINDGRYI